MQTLLKNNFIIAMIHFARSLRLCKLETQFQKQEGTMGRKWAYAAVAIVLDFVVLCPANAQPAFSSASGEDHCLAQAHSVIMQSGRSFGPDTDPTETAARPPFAPASSGYGPLLVFFVVAVELALAVATAVACWLVLVIAGICVSIEDRRRLKIVLPFLPDRLALHPTTKTSRVCLKGKSSASSHARVYMFAVLLFALPTCSALQPELHHPLDALTPEEYWKVYHVLSDAGKLAEKTQFSSILLHEPPKAEVLAWKPGKPFVRKVDVVLLTEGKSYAAVVNVSSGKLESWAELTKDQTPASLSGFDDVLKKDPRVLAALKSRGITDLRLVNCEVIQADFVDLPEQTEGRRIGWGVCDYIADTLYAWDDDIAGIFVVVDMDTKKILRFSDSGAVPS